MLLPNRLKTLRIVKAFAKFRSWLGRLYAPNEVRALGLFACLGFVVLAYRLGIICFRVVFPSSQPTSYAKDRLESDSIFAALSAKAKSEDSLVFALPEDSLLPQHTRSALHRKGSLIPPHSIVLNAASKAELMQLPAVGEATAELIIQYRAERGAFRSVDELRNVKSIGEKRLQKMKQFLRLN